MLSKDIIGTIEISILNFLNPSRYGFVRTWLCSLKTAAEAIRGEGS